MKKLFFCTIIMFCFGCARQTENYSEKYLRFIPLSDGTFSVAGGDAIHLEEIDIPSFHEGKKVSKIEEYGFKGFNEMKKIRIPNTILQIGFGAFEGCNSLPEITLPFVGPYINSDYTFGYVFGDDSYSIANDSIPTSLKSITIMSGVTTLTRNAFSMCKNVEKIVLPDSVNLLGSYCFAGCRKLESFIIPNGVETLSGLMFSECWAMETITIPKSIKELALSFIANCPSLNTINYLGTVSEWGAIIKNGAVPSSLKTYNVTCTDGIAEYK